MKKISRTVMLIILMSIVLIGAFSCTQNTGGTITQEEYNAIKAQLSAAEAKIAKLEASVVQSQSVAALGEKVLKDEIAALKAKIDSLGNNITELTVKNSGLTQEKTLLDSKYTELVKKYSELETSMAALTKPEIITEEKVENEIFKLLNQERVKAGIPDFIWGKNLYLRAKQNSKSMAELGKLAYAADVLYQEISIAPGYEKVDSIARGAILTWKLDQYKFEHGALLIYNTYGTVGAFKSGDIFYITFLAAIFP